MVVGWRWQTQPVGGGGVKVAEAAVNFIVSQTRGYNNPYRDRVTNELLEYQAAVTPVTYYFEFQK